LTNKRRLQAGGVRQASAGDYIVELARKLAPVRSSHAQAFSPPGWTDTELAQPFEAATVEPSIGFAPDEASGTASADLTSHACGLGVPYLHNGRGACRAKQRRSGGWILRAAAIAPVAGAALLGAGLVTVVFGPKAGSLRFSKPPFVASGQLPTKTSQGSGETVATLEDAAAIPVRDVIPVKVVRSEERPIDPGPGVSSASAPATAPSAPTPVGAAQSTPWTSAGPPVSAPVVTKPAAAPPPAASQSSDGNPDRTASAAAGEAARPADAVQRPDRPTPAAESKAAAAAQPTTLDSAAVEAGRPANAPQRPARPASADGIRAAPVAQPVKPRLDLRARFSRRPSARVMPAIAAETGSQPLRPAASTTPRVSTAPQALVAPQAAPATAAQQPVDPVGHAFGAIAGALRASKADQSAASKSGDWALQFAAPKSEAKAKAAAALLNARYARELNGTTIGVQKTVANGEMTYVLRVPGLSKAEAAALCERLKGRDCSAVK
jgi:SPOR domain